MKRRLFLAMFLAFTIMQACTTRHELYRRDGVLRYDGKNYNFSPTSDWYRYTPTKEHDTLFQYVVK